MRAVATLLRAFSYLYHTALSLFLLAIAGLAASGPSHLNLPILPWTGSTLVYIVAGGGFAGLVSVVLAFLGKVRWLFVIWSLVVAVALLRGYASATYHFAPGGYKLAVYLIAGSLLAVLGAWSRLRTPAEKARQYRTR